MDADGTEITGANHRVLRKGTEMTEIDQYAQEIRNHLPDITEDEMAEALARIAADSPEQRAFFREVRRVAPHVTYGWDRDSRHRLDETAGQTRFLCHSVRCQGSVCSRVCRCAIAAESA